MRRANWLASPTKSPAGATHEQLGATPQVNKPAKNPPALKGRSNRGDDARRIMTRATRMARPFRAFDDATRYPGRCPGLELKRAVGAEDGRALRRDGGRIDSSKGRLCFIKPSPHSGAEQQRQLNPEGFNPIYEADPENSFLTTNGHE